MSTKSARMTRSIEERFMALVDRSSPAGCWEWRGALSTSGYGVLQRGRRGAGLVRAHRYAYESHHGPIPAGRIVCHRCDNKRCVNPTHLYAGTHTDNLRDALDRGRNPMHVNRRAQTHCVRGHEFSAANTRHYAGRRICLTCSREAQRCHRKGLAFIRVPDVVPTETVG